MRCTRLPAAVAADALAEAAGWAERDGETETARMLDHLADDIEAASVTPAAIRNAARYLGPSYAASLAITTAAAVAWSAGGQSAKDEVLERCRWAIENAATEGYPERSGPRKPWFGLVPPATAARVARRKKLGLPPAPGKDERTSS